MSPFTNGKRSVHHRPADPGTKRTAFGRGIAVLLAVALSGCSASRTFHIDSITNPEIGRDDIFAYALVSSDVELREDDLRFQEVVRYVEAALSGHGYYEADSRESADIIVDVAIGLNGPVVEWKHQPSHSYRTISPSQARVYAVTRYDKYLRLTAHRRLSEEEKTNNPPEQVWSIYVLNQDGSDNLRHYVPLMAAASVPYIDEDSGKRTTIRLKQDSALIAFVTASQVDGL